MTDYTQGKIYAIKSKNFEKYYIGSTCKPLNTRLKFHLENLEKYQDGTHNYETSFDVLDKGKFRIELIEEYPCESRKELEKREGYHIKKHKEDLVNRNIAGRTDKEYTEDNKERINEYKKKHYAENKDKINQYKKEWYLKNKQRLLAKGQMYYADKKEVINEKIACGCGSTFSKQYATRHGNTKKHQEYLVSEHTVKLI
ncbi:MAG: GIY-YIG nuclease family protein [Legionella sp.]|uniref:GIY-YIG nuclease family protein n=1 Tax=Legionella sp. TaxID=459 RepID=UPI002844DDEE|nr:GIY-YIG nuclease family protein [Legionella sp.]